MHILEASILLIILIVLSNIVSHYIVSVPTALIEIAVGFAVALIFKVKIDLEADWFMLLFVAPLLYNDSKRFPKNELWELRAPIFANAIWLVLLTTFLGGYLIHWVIPDIPFTLAIALAAVLSPTDPVAVHGIAEQVKLPKKILSLISGESLINDASGLIAFKYAAAAFLTSQFSLKDATFDFLYMALMGCFIGAALSYLFHYLRIFLVQQGIRDVVLHTTIRILTPFVIFLVADETAHASGVIAVVAAGVLSINQSQIFRGEFSEIRLVTHKIWDILIYLLNGAVFIILGIELPTVMSETLINPDISNVRLVFYTLTIWLILLLIRIIWSYSFMWLSYSKKSQDAPKPKFYTALLTGLTGVRGAITMATVMSLPLILPNGKQFTQRPLIIFLACSVVLTSLLIATVTLPFLTKQKKRLVLIGDDSLANSDMPGRMLKEKSDQRLTELEARKLMIKNAIELLKENRDEANQLVMNDILHEFEVRLRHLYREQNTDETNSRYHTVEKKVQLVAFKGELEGIKRAVGNGSVPEKEAQKYLKTLYAKQQALAGGVKNFVKRNSQILRKKIARLYFKLFAKNTNDQNSVAFDSTLLVLEKESCREAIRSLTVFHKTANKAAPDYTIQKHLVKQFLNDYRNKMERIKHIRTYSKKEYHRVFQEFYLKALDAERTTVQELFEEQQISLFLANDLRENINYYEISLLQGVKDSHL